MHGGEISNYNSFFLTGPHVPNQNTREAIQHTKRTFLGENFKCFLPGLSAAIDDIYTPLNIVTENPDEDSKGYEILI